MSQAANGVSRGGAAVRGGRGGRGGGRGGKVKRGGPAPARHIPWPEIFKHHISLVEGHLKMIDMVRKHTVEGSGNHRTISSLIDRARAMLKDARNVEREFVPPRDAWRNVPIGSSSDTMYPGYSPKDHEYGKAAEEFGKSWSEARKKGIEFNAKPNGPEYEFGQSKGAKRRRISEDEPASNTEAQDTSAAQDQSQAQPADQLFYFDSNPAPVNSAKLSRVTATKHYSYPFVKDGLPEETGDSIDQIPQPVDNVEPVVEYENIDRQVDARLKLKEEAKRNRTDKKRKRNSATSVQSANGGDEPSAQAQDKEKPAKKKKKSKSSKDKEVEAMVSADGVVAVSDDADKDGDVRMQDLPERTDARVDDVEVTAASTSGEKDKQKKKTKDKGKIKGQTVESGDGSNKKIMKSKNKA